MSFCQHILVDGEPVLLRVTELLDADEIDAFSELIGAARRKYETDHPTPEKETPHGD